MFYFALPLHTQKHIRTTMHLSKEHAWNFETHSHLRRNQISRTQRPLPLSIWDPLRFARKIRNQTYHHTLLLPQITIPLPKYNRIYSCTSFLRSPSPSTQTQTSSPLLQLSYAHTNEPTTIIINPLLSKHISIFLYQRADTFLDRRRLWVKIFNQITKFKLIVVGMKPHFSNFNFRYSRACS